MSTFQTLSIFDDLDCFGHTGQIFYRISFNLGLSGVFLMVKQRLCVLGRE